MLATDQQRPGQVVAGEADLVQTHPELDPLQLGVVLAYLARLAPGAGGHHLNILGSHWLSSVISASDWLPLTVPTLLIP